MYQILGSMNDILNFISPFFYKVLYMSTIATIIGIIIIIIKKIFYNNLSPLLNMMLWSIFVIVSIVPIKIELSNNINNIIPISNIENISTITSNSTLFSNISDGSNELIIEENDLNTPINNTYNNESNAYIRNLQNQYYIKSIIINRILPVIWVGGIFLILIFYTISYIIFNKKLGRKYSKDNRIIKILNDSRKKLNINKNIQVLEQELVNSPSIFGISNIRILVNKTIYNMSDEQIKYILIHELSHYKKKDNIINLLFMIIQSIHWFNPIMWYMFSEIRKDIEIFTDSVAIDKLEKNEHKNYCKTLVEIANLRNSVNIMPKFLCISDNKNNLERRINMIKLSNFFSKKKVLTGTILVILLAFLSIYILATNSINNNLNISNSYKNPIIPQGFKKVETDKASWKLEKGIPKGWNDGLVIEDELGNQFVWVPVNIENLKYSDWYKQNHKVYEKDSLNKDEIEDEQILKYGGFYIARYEAGVSNDMNDILNNISADTNDIKGLPVSKKNVRVWNFISLKNAKNNAMSMYNNEVLQSDLVTEKQWVTIMQWLSYDGYDVGSDSSGFGNYSNVNFKFTGLYSIDYGKNYKYGENINKSEFNMILSSGSTDRNMTKNIYDLAGNVLEYTNEYTQNNGGGYYCAGGHFDNTGGYSANNLSLINTKPLEKVGFRIILYMK